MMRIKNIVTGLCFMLLFCAAAAEQAPLVIPIIKPPKLDGTLNDPAWQNAMKIGQLYLLNTNKPARDTTVYLARDKKWLYLGFRCVNSNMVHVDQTCLQHDGAAQMDDSVEVFIRPDPANGRYYHFMLNFANVSHDKRCNRDGLRDVNWNPPWRSMTKRLPDGWAAEMAIPLYVLESDDLSGMQVNICRNLTAVDLDPYGAKQNEKRIFQVLKPDNNGNPHDFKNYFAVSGLGGFKPEIPFAPRIAAAEVPGLRQKDGQYFYDVKMTLKTASPVAGKAKVQVIEDLGAGDVEKTSELVDLEGTRELVLSVPAGDLRERKVRVALVDPADGNTLDSRAIGDMSALSVIRKALVGRSYYTTEDAVAIRLEFGLPEAMLKQATLVIDVNGAKVSEIQGLTRVMMPESPLRALKIGANTVEIHVISNGKELASKTLAVARLEPRPGFEVKTDFIKGIILKDDKPFFPVGIYTHNLGQYWDKLDIQDNDEGFFKFFSDVGFNTLGRLGGMYKDVDMFMRLADKYGMNVINWSVPEPPALTGIYAPPGSPDFIPLPERLAIQKKWYKNLEQGIVAETKILREHRNLLGYYNVDEPNLVNPEERIAAAEWYWNTVSAIDPYRLQFLLYSMDIPKGDNWTRWGQMLGYDIYPRPFMPDSFGMDEPGLYTARYAYELRERCRQDNKVMFFVPLANMLELSRSPIAMNKAHMLCQAYTAVIYGSRGLLYFCLTTVVGEEAWDALRTICAQIKELTPALVNGDIGQNIKYTPDDFRPAERKFPMVNAAVFKYPHGDYLLMAANIMPFAVDTTFRVGGMKNASRLFESKGKIELNGESFKDKIEPYGVRAYKIELAGSPDPVQVALDMIALEDEKAPSVDIPGIARQLMLGKNYVANPCFKQQFIKGFPDFYMPYFCLTPNDPTVWQKGANMYVDNEMLWEGNPSLHMFRRQEKAKAPKYKVRGISGSLYPPISDKPVKMTFSFYARGQKEGDSIWARLFDGESEQSTTFPLSTEWRRYHLTNAMPPGTGLSGLGLHKFIVEPNEGATVWISGFQVEAGETPTEFQDDSVIEKKKKTDEDPGNLIRNAGAEYGTTEFWSGLDDFSRLELGLRHGAGRSGEYAFLWRKWGEGHQSAWIRTDLIGIDPAKAYDLSGFFKSDLSAIARPGSEAKKATAKGDELTTLEIFGVLMYDAQKRLIQRVNVFSVAGTRTELVEACKPKDKVLKVRNSSAWKTGPLFVAAFGREENVLNFDVTPRGIEKVRRVGDHWEIVMQEPCGLAFPAGTLVVENCAGDNGIFLPRAGNVKIPGEWTEIKGRIGPEQWWPGTAYISIVIKRPSRVAYDVLLPGTLLMDDFSLRLAPR